MLGAYADALPEIQAEQQLLAIEAACVPTMKESAAREVTSGWRKRLGGVKRALSMHEAMLEAGVRVRRTKVKKKPSGGPRDTSGHDQGA